MFAVQYHRFGPPDVLTVADHEEPHAGPGQIRVRVEAAGVSPVDLNLRAGTTPMAGRLTLPHIPGVDAAGMVDEVGEGVTGTATGDAVFGAVDLARLGGASAEYAVLTEWGRKASSMTWTEAGAAGTSVETATRALDLLALDDGMTLIITGAAGGVGSVAVQLAVARGVRVIGTGRPVSLDFIASLGATPVSYERELTVRADRALDVAGAGSLPALIEATGGASAVVSLADFGAAALGVRLSMGRLAGEPGGWHGLAEAATLHEAGRFRVPVRAAYPIKEAAEAHAAAEKGPQRGKVALTLT